MNVVDRTDIFIIYSHQDERWRSELEPYLTRNMRQSAVKTWSTDQIRSDSKWCPDIQSVLDHSKVVVMLVTPVFLDSAFIDEHGLEPLLEGAEKSGISIRWILVRACAWNGTPVLFERKFFQAGQLREKFQGEQRVVFEIAFC